MNNAVINAFGLPKDTLISDFKEFFSSLNNGEKPYQWQVRLLEFLIDNKKWPDMLDVPTGAGKTSAIEIHLFLNGAIGTHKSAIPRRLLMTVNRRALVDSQFEHAKQIHENMLSGYQENPEGIIGKIVTGLIQRQVGTVKKKNNIDFFSTVELRGGLDDLNANSRDWKLHPTRVMIICATPDMIGSRLLFRGYGTSKRARPIEAGLLAYDSVLFLDEAHLNRQLNITARQIKRIESYAEHPLKASPLQVCAASATQVNDSKWYNPEKENELTAIKLEQKDFEVDQTLRKRMLRPKPVTTFEVNTRKKDWTKQIVGLCQNMHQQVGGTIGCIFNSAHIASVFAQKLEQVAPHLHVECIVGKMRPFDRKHIEKQLLDPDQFAKIDILVGTQTLEVGLDVDFRGLITELADQSALIQRSGRVNRFGKYKDAPIWVWAPKELKNSIYVEKDLKTAKAWLESLNENGLRPLLSSKAVHPRRRAFERLELTDVDYLSNTGEDMAAESPVLTGHPSNLDLWLRDDFSESPEVYFVVRKRPQAQNESSMVRPISDANMTKLLELVPPIEVEMIPCIIPWARNVLNVLTDPSSTSNSSVLLIRHDAPITACTSETSIAPGDIFVVSDEVKIFLRDIVYMPKDKGTLTENNISKDDIYYKAISEKNQKKDFPVPLFVLPEVDSLVEKESISIRCTPELKEIATEYIENPTEFENITIENALNNLTAADHQKSPVAEQLLEAVHNDNGAGTWDLLLWGDLPDDGFAIVYTPSTSGLQNFSERMSHNTNRAVLLKDHNAAVSERASQIADNLYLTDREKQTLIVAGKWHDAGKIDPRFQELLRLNSSSKSFPDLPLAKGRQSSRQKERIFRKTCALDGWRHEQLSAAMVWSSAEDFDNLDKELVARLVGQSHGHGCTLFKQNSNELLRGIASIETPDQSSNKIIESASLLFDTGLWDRIVSLTNHRYGYWATAYLEALLRAADAQVSAEGR